MILGGMKKVNISKKVIIDESEFCIHLMEEDTNAKALLQCKRVWEDVSSESVLSMEEGEDGRLDMVGMEEFGEST